MAGRRILESNCSQKGIAGISFTLFLLLLLLFPVQSHCEETVELIYSSGMAEIADLDSVTGLSRLQSLLKAHKQKAPGQVFFLHGGSAFAPAILSSMDKGAHMVSLLNSLNPDVLVIGRSDFTHGEDELTLRSMEARFPLVVSNIYDPITRGNIEGIRESQILTSSTGTKIGVMGFVDPEFIVDYMPARVTYMDSVQTLRNGGEKLRQLGADFILLLADFKIAKLSLLLEDLSIDLAILRSPDNGVVQLISREGVKSIDRGKISPLSLSLNFNKHNRGQFILQSKLLDIHKYPADPKLTGSISSYLSSLREILAGVVGHTATRIDTRRISVRTMENGFANFIADVIRKFYKADISLINGGCIRGNREYPANTPITRGDIWRELPFNNRIVRIQVSGSQLRDAIENGLSRIEDMKGRFPHVSGIEVNWDPSAPPGRRVVSIRVNHNQMEPNRLYLLATTDYLAKGGDGYESLVKGIHMVKEGGGLPLWEYVKNEINREHTIFPRVEGRMKAVGR